ncbi:MAG: glutaredoxin family protein [Candidatus Woesearchaeota archaeon]
MASVTIYTTNVCPWCHKAKDFFDENGIKYSEKNVQQNREYQAELLEKSGQLGVPVITVDDETVIGFNKERLKKILNL